MQVARIVVIYLIVLVVNISEIYGIAISPKLDFPEKSGVIEVRKDIKDGRIKGLRVTVDTSELKESKSSGSESSDSESSSEKKKTVGVRTDVTFEITSGETNDTKTIEIGKDDDNNASIPVVPVFKGTPDRGGSNNGKNTDPSYNEILSVLPLESTSAPPVNIFNQPSRAPLHPSYPQHAQHHGYPNRYGGGENRFGGGENRFGGGEISDRSDGWNVLYPQYEIWTTERNNHRRFEHQPPSAFHPSNEDRYQIFKKPSSFIPYPIHHNHRHLSSHHQPCHCKEYPGPQIVGVRPLQPTLTDEFKHTNKIDDKLERPFSKTSKK